MSSSVSLRAYVHEFMLINVLSGKLNKRDFDDDFRLYMDHLMRRGHQMLEILRARNTQLEPAIDYEFLQSIFDTPLRRFQDLQDLLSRLLRAAIENDYWVPKEMMDIFRALSEIMKHMLG